MKIYLKIKKNAKKKVIRSIGENYYEICTTISPEKGKANQDIINILSEFLHVSKTKIKIIKGEFCKKKIAEIKQMT
jgi:uncharacterized protein YggU (UPF0235/DUF167 family)